MGLVSALLHAANDAAAAVHYVLRGRRPRDGLSVLRFRHTDPAAFKRQLRAIGLARGVRIVSLSEADRWLDNDPPRGSHVLFTFDDALRAQLHPASELMKYGLCGTFLIPIARDTGQLDDESIGLLVRMGHDVQPMLCDRREIASLTPEELWNELGHTLDFCSRFAKPFTVAYPARTAARTLGRRVTKAIAERGIRLGFTNERGRNSFGHLRKHPLLLRRITMEGREPAIVTQAKAAGYVGPLAFVERVLSRSPGL